MKRVFALFLTMALLLSGCGAAKTDPRLSADEVARAILSACEPPETEQVSGDDLSLWLTGFYSLREGDWEDCAVYRAADPSHAFEIAVIRLSEDAPLQRVLDGLNGYLVDRQGDFTGYDPEQAAIVSGGRVALSEGGRYAALLICGQSSQAEGAFFAALGQGAPPPSQPAVTTPVPYEGRVPFTAPNIDDMTIYDTSAIVEAWHSGDDSTLSDDDRTILNRCRAVLDSILTPDMSDYEKEVAIYQWVVTHVEYDYDHYDRLAQLSPHSSTPYNPLVNGKGICLGFAVTFQLLAELAGLECIVVVGAAFLSQEDHAWNMVRLDGQWYCVDATWDTGFSRPVSWDYFNVTSDYMAATDHQWDYANVPEATATDGGQT